MSIEMETEETFLWKETKNDWLCPGCMRRKHECEVVSAKGKTLRKLVEHHDHMRDYPKHYIKQKYGSLSSAREISTNGLEFNKHLDKVKIFATRFNYTTVCLDCNEIEGKIKKHINADKFFSFSAQEIRRGFKKKPNKRHTLIEENMALYRAIYDGCHKRLVLQRKKIIETIIDSAISERSSWGGDIELSRLFDEDILQRKYPEFTSSTEQKESISRGEPARDFHPWTKKEVSEMLTLLEKGRSYDEIAKILGRTPGAIFYKEKSILGEK